MLHLSFNTYVYRRQDKALAEQEIKHKDAFALQEKRHDKALENLTLEKHDLLERMDHASFQVSPRPGVQARD